MTVPDNIRFLSPDPSPTAENAYDYLNVTRQLAKESASSVMLVSQVLFCTGAVRTTELDFSSKEKNERVLSVRDLVNQALSPTEIAILSAAMEFRKSKGRPPTASDIRLVVSKRLGLKKTQLYDLLRRLTILGFVTVKTLPRPRRYIVNRVTLMSGIANWIEAQKRSVLGMTEEIDALVRLLQGPKIRMHDWLPMED